MVLTATIINITQDQYMLPRVHLMYIDVIREVNKIPTAQLIVLDGDAAKQKFSISNSNFFAPGQEIQIKLRDDNKKDQTIFEGIIVRHRIKTDKNGSYLTLDLKDQAFKLTTQRKSRLFKNQEDSNIIKEILNDNKIPHKNITETNYKHPEIVQYYCTDWDFILSRADANGQWIIVEDGQIETHVIKLDLSNPQYKLIYTYGDTIIHDFEMEIDNRQLSTQIEGKVWDVVKQELLIQKEQVEQEQQVEPCTLVHPVPLKKEELKAWVEAKKSKSELSNIKGYLKVDGNVEIKLGDLIELKGIGDRFNGGKVVTGIRHQVSENSWLTDVQFGLSADWFSQRNDIVDTPAAGLVPAINGLHIGIVQEGKEADPEGHYRIKVWVPAFGERKEAIVWARWASPYAGENRGMFFKPDKGDEVVLGFFNDDPRQAVILGSMYSKANPPNEVFVDNNSTKNFKGMATKEGYIILLGDDVNLDKQKFNKSIVLSDKHIKIANKQDKSYIELNAQGIEINTNQEVNIKTTQPKKFNANKLQA